MALWRGLLVCAVAPICTQLRNWCMSWQYARFDSYDHIMVSAAWQADLGTTAVVALNGTIAD